MIIDYLYQQMHLVHLLVQIINYKKMHGEYKVKFSDAQQAKTIYKFQRIKEKIHKTNAS
jgi:hypothetical protein